MLLYTINLNIWQLDVVDKTFPDLEIMNMIQSLQNDPDFQQILQDPEIMKAVSNGEVATLMANPKFTSILDNKKSARHRYKTAKVILRYQLIAFHS
jgi:hypothetical protein